MSVLAQLDSAPALLRPGTVLAPGFLVVEHLRRGEDFDVYDVWSEQRDCRCIAKTLRPDVRRQRRPKERLLREGELLCRFTHPHLVRAYEVLERPQPIVILETLTGETLGHLLERRRRRLPAADICHLGLHLCSALHYLHANGYLHLDLKPSNVVADRGRAKLLDLSLARPPGPGRRGVGTRGYLAPEQADGSPFSAATDVYGLGATLFEVATGRRPFAGDDRGDDGEDIAAVYPQLHRPAPPVASLRRMPAGLAGLIDRCLERPAGRRPSISDLAGGLDEVITRLDGAA